MSTRQVLQGDTFYLLYILKLYIFYFITYNITLSYLTLNKQDIYVLDFEVYTKYSPLK